MLYTLLAVILEKWSNW